MIHLIRHFIMPIISQFIWNYLRTNARCFIYFFVIEIRKNFFWFWGYTRLGSCSLQATPNLVMPWRVTPELALRNHSGRAQEAIGDNRNQTQVSYVPGKSPNYYNISLTPGGGGRGNERHLFMPLMFCNINL